jgi:hypothetical protein
MTKVSVVHEPTSAPPAIGGVIPAKAGTSVSFKQGFPLSRE